MKRGRNRVSLRFLRLIKNSLSLNYPFINSKGVKVQLNQIIIHPQKILRILRYTILKIKSQLLLREIR